MTGVQTCALPIFRRQDESIRELKTQIEKLKRDALTGLETRHNIKEKEERRKQSGKPWSVLILDVDKFKGINDAHGHKTGDDVLRATDEFLQHTFRKDDVVLRWGGEEFVVILKDANPQDIVNKLYNKEGRIARIGFEAKTERGEIAVTLSGGITSFEREEDVEDAIYRADEALLFSKNRGRNQITAWGDLEQ